MIIQQPTSVNGRFKQAKGRQQLSRCTRVCMHPPLRICAPLLSCTCVRACARGFAWRHHEGYWQDHPSYGHLADKWIVSVVPYFCILFLYFFTILFYLCIFSTKCIFYYFLQFFSSPAGGALVKYRGCKQIPDVSLFRQRKKIEDTADAASATQNE